MTDAELVSALRNEAAHALLNTSVAPKDLLTRAADAIARLAADGPIVQRGTAGDGSPRMGTMREAWNDGLLAARVEAGLRDEARAEVLCLEAKVEKLSLAARRWQAMRQLLEAVDWKYEGSPSHAVAIFQCKAAKVFGGPKGADAIADAAIQAERPRVKPPRPATKRAPRK